MKIVKLAPLAGKLVRDPNTYEILPTDGKQVELTPFWQRRITAGDVALVGTKKASGKNKN